jgi:hypothetical protein
VELLDQLLETCVLFLGAAEQWSYIDTGEWPEPIE